MAEPQQPGQQQQVQVQISIEEGVAQGVYANLALLSVTEAEFTLDFLYLQPQAPKATVRARVITSPQHAKRLAMVLQENIARYEAANGEIKLGPGPAGLPGRH